MAAASDARPAGERLDPLALPADTPFRFALLVAAVLGSTLYVYEWLYLRHVLSPELAAAKARCVDAVQVSIADAAFGGLVQQQQLQTCIGRDSGLAQFMFGGAFYVLVLALVVCLVLPHWRIWREHLVPLPAADIPGLADALDGLVHEAGLRQPPTFLFQPLRAVPGGLAFGRPGRRYLALTGGLVATYLTDPPLFRGIVRHELSHLRNRDLDQTYGAVAIVAAFVALAGIPFAISFALDPPAALLDVLLRFGALGLLVALSFAAVLRSRELFADAAAGGHDDEGGLRRALGGAGDRTPRVPALALHPAPATRLRALDDPAELFSPSAWTAFAAGFAAALALATVQEFVANLTTDADLARHAAALTFAPLVAAVAGFGVWRDAYRTVHTGASPELSALVGIALGGGIVAGREVALQNVVTGRVLSEKTVEHVLSAWSLATIVACILLVRWLWSVAVVAQRSTLAERWPRLAPVAATALASLVIWLLLELLLLAQALYDAGDVLRATFSADYANASTLVATEPRWLWTLLESSLSNIVTGRTSTFLVLLALAAGPFALATRVRDGAVRFPATLRPLPAAAVGVAAGLAEVGAIVVARAVIRATYPLDERATLAFAQGFQHLLFTAAIVAGITAAAVAALVAPAHRVIHGLLAAVVCAVVGGLGAEGILPSIAGCFPDISLAATPVCGTSVDVDGTWLVIRLFAGASAIPAIAAAGAVALAVTWLRGPEAGLGDAHTSPSTAVAHRDA
jgi:Zn-dependent protease with chaperone function